MFLVSPLSFFWILTYLFVCKFDIILKSKFKLDYYYNRRTRLISIHPYPTKCEHSTTLEKLFFTKKWYDTADCKTQEESISPTKQKSCWVLEWESNFWIDEHMFLMDLGSNTDLGSLFNLNILIYYQIFFSFPKKY